MLLPPKAKIVFGTLAGVIPQPLSLNTAVKRFVLLAGASDSSKVVTAKFDFSPESRYLRSSLVASKGVRNGTFTLESYRCRANRSMTLSCMLVTCSMSFRS
ncbi:hypothetical protein [Streptomyces adustus]|uniref:hypothetical protein n=1 Tax=Streptomyces adustus TaxID=1609272 RepID=UPI003718B86A